MPLRELGWGLFPGRRARSRPRSGWETGAARGAAEPIRRLTKLGGLRYFWGDLEIQQKSGSSRSTPQSSLRIFFFWLNRAGVITVSLAGHESGRWGQIGPSSPPHSRESLLSISMSDWINTCANETLPGPYALGRSSELRATEGGSGI